MAQHEVTGSAGRPPRQGQEFDWWSGSGAIGSEETDQRSSGFPGEPVNEPIHEPIDELMHEFMREPIRELMHDSLHDSLHEPAHELRHESLHESGSPATRPDSPLTAQTTGRPTGGRSQRTGSTAFAEPDESARSVLSTESAEPAESTGTTSAIPAQRPSGVPGSPGSLSEDREQDPVAAEVYREVQQSQAFQEIRRSHRRFVFPATAAFVCWYLFYVTVLAAAPGLMRTQLAGPFSVAWLLGLLQFASTFVITWLYARNARTKRDRAALGLRWDTQDQLR
ncbi:uncharacterized membrane protein (DUF485 family) [Kitasatospora sp. GP30]|nr:uncharacterized membrane protein (DUF485 family) [Kitasatospora sp. GP30]